jgi:hypothetical protein
MPVPQASFISMTATNHFRSLGIVHPSDWSQPTGEAGRMFVEAFPESERAVPVDPMLLFRPASNNKYHVDACKDVGGKVQRFIEETSKALVMGWQQWCLGTTVAGVMINGPVGMLAPGNLISPPAFPMCMPTALKDTPLLLAYSRATLQAFGDALQVWALGYTATLNYPPTFATCPMPMHPPMPNIPSPIGTAGKSPGEVMLEVEQLKGMMIANHGDPMAPHHAELFESMATGINKAFAMWLQSTPLQLILGTGPVPTFAPPVAPAGPVVAGTGFSAGPPFA